MLFEPMMEGLLLKPVVKFSLQFPDHRQGAQALSVCRKKKTSQILPFAGGRLTGNERLRYLGPSLTPPTLVLCVADSPPDCAGSHPPSVRSLAGPP